MTLLEVTDDAKRELISKWTAESKGLRFLAFRVYDLGVRVLGILKE